MKKATKDFFEISNFKIKESKGEWKNIIIESQTKIEHQILYNFFKTKSFGKIYFIEGEGKKFGLISDEGPAKYF